MSDEKPPVEICKGVNDLDKVVLRGLRGSSAEVYLYGGHVTSWKNNHDEELLFLSSKVPELFAKHQNFQTYSLFILMVNN
ncbi:unnamed protein product [Musa textilis]